MTWILASMLLLSLAANIPLAILVNKAAFVNRKTLEFNQELIRGLTLPPEPAKIEDAVEQMEFWGGPDIEQDEWMNSLLTGTPPLSGGWVGEGESSKTQTEPNLEE